MSCTHGAVEGDGEWLASINVAVDGCDELIEILALGGDGLIGESDQGDDGNASGGGGSSADPIGAAGDEHAMDETVAFELLEDALDLRSSHPVEAASSSLEAKAWGLDFQRNSRVRSRTRCRSLEVAKVRLSRASTRSLGIHADQGREAEAWRVAAAALMGHRLSGRRSGPPGTSGAPRTETPWRGRNCAVRYHR